MPVIKASEIGTFIYCRKAWWYRRQGIEPENKAELAAGSDFHQRHGQTVLSAGLMRLGAWLVLGTAVILFAILFTLQALR